VTYTDEQHKASRFSPAVDGDDFKSDACGVLFAYWREKAAGRTRPAWRDLSLMDIYTIAPFVVVRDVVDGGREFRCRFCGTGMAEVLGFDLTGTTLAERYAPHGVEIMMRRYQAVLELERPLRAVGYIHVVEKNMPTAFESVVLPLDGDDGDGRIRHLISVHDLTYVPEPGEVDPPA
jgi:hypothetical protein